LRVLAAALTIGLLLTLGLFATLAVFADGTELFRSGLEAVDRGQWAVAVERFREAAAEDGQEADRRIFVSGVFSYPYLPHFYLGWALYKAGPENCEEALGELEISVQQGVIDRFRRQLKELREAEGACNGRLSPVAAAAAAQAIEKASTLLQGYPEVLADPDLESDRQGATGTLETARSSFAAGQESTRVREYRQAESQAYSVVEVLGDIDRRLASAPSPEVPVPSLEVPAPSLELPEQAAAEAGQESEVGTVLESSEPEGTRAVEGIGPVESTSLPVAAGQAGDAEQPESTGLELGFILRKVAAARDLLSLMGDEKGGELYEVQKSRLEGFLVEADLGSTEDLQDLGRRLTESTEALRLIAGVRAFLAAEPERCAALLEASEYPSPRLAGEAYLFVAAARFALYRRGAEADETLRDQAVAAARLSLLHEPSRVLAERPFSPGFRELFASVASEVSP